jgi:hypothetical protein
MVGSASHLAKVGVESYAAELLRTVEAISGRVGGNAHVIPAILLPAAGYERGELIRHLADFDSWAVTVAPTENVSLAAARSEIWNVIKKLGSGKNDSNKVKGLQLPLGFRNTRRGNFTAGVIENLPNRVNLMDPETEQDCLRLIAKTLNVHYCLGLDENVSVQRGAGASPNENTGRVAIIGASHSKKYAASDALRNGTQISDLPHWTPDAKLSATIAKKIKDLKLDDNDCLVLDIFSNSAFMGTDNRGLPLPASQDGDGTYHIEGQLDIAPLRSLTIVASMGKKLIEAAGSAKVIVVLPVPRYVIAGCCTSPGHITNWCEADYQALLASAAHTCKSVMEDVMTGSSANIIYYNPVSTFNDGPLMDMKSSTGDNIWLGDDSVHLTDAAYGDIGAAILDLWRNSEFTARKRVDSIIVEGGAGRGRGGRGGYRGGGGGAGHGRGRPYNDNNRNGANYGRRFNPYPRQ